MIYLGADHGGFQLKEEIKQWLKKENIAYKDLGAQELDPHDDYPKFAFKVAEIVAQDPKNKGILLCRSASGMVIAANKIKGIRAVSVVDEKSTKHGVVHNNANIIAISGDWVDEKIAIDIVKTFLETKFSKEERHMRRLKQISEKEEEVFCGCVGEDASCCGGMCHD